MANYVLASADGIATTKYGSSVKNQISKRTVTGALSYNIAFRDVNLAKNPYKNRYAPEGISTDMNGFEKIGAYIDVYNHEKHIITFLDDWGGLKGYTDSNEFKPKFSDYREIYSISGDNFYSVSTELNAYSYKDSMSIEDGVQDIGKEILKIKGISTYIPRKRLSDASTYLVYQEDGIPTMEDYSHIEGNNMVDVIEEDEEYEKTSLLNRTNKLFRDGKIHSLINRFGTGAIGDAAEAKRDLLHTAFSEFGYSRGRNLLKLDPDVINTYENPYCRVWTSHHQYSKMTDLIRPFVDGFGQFESLYELQRKYGMLRPNYSNARLRDYSSLERGGILRIAPDKEFLFGQGFAVEDHGEIRNYMLSIENLAWKNAGEFYTSYLSREQKGPFGGRIMWFVPYNLKFSEQSSSEWNQVSFIGRGENVHTYKGSQRTGNLSFDIIVDHPSIINLFKEKGTLVDEEEVEQALLRYFAGCEDLSAYIPTGLPQEWMHYSAYTETTTTVTTTNGPEKTVEVKVETNDEIKQESIEEKIEPEPDPVGDGIECCFIVFYPNNVTGQYKIPIGSKGKEGDKLGKDTTFIETDLPGYENGDGHGCGKKYYNLSNYPEEICHVGEKLVTGGCSYDGRDFGLNTKAFIDAANEYITGETKDKFNTKDKIEGTDLTYKNITTIFTALKFPKTNGRIFGLEDINEIKNLKQFLEEKIKVTGETQEYQMTDYSYYGFASHAGYNNKNRKDRLPIESKYKSRNDELAHNRAQTLFYTLDKKELGFKPEDNGDKIVNDSPNGIDGETVYVDSGSHTINKLTAKLGRAAILRFKLSRIVPDFGGDQETSDSAVIPPQTENTFVTGSTTATVESKEIQKVKYFNWSEQVDTVAFDNEYLMFDRIKNEKDNIVDRTLKEKFKFLEPGFHSTTPEGLNARLTFLNQCVRQGPTNGASDMNNRSTFGAANLAFGKPPVCVLRIGDFYFGKVIFNSLSISYDNNGLQWDMNPEGIGLQPMKASVNMGVTFLGGMDITGPIEQLQNAVSSNYYANTSIYDKSSSTNSIGEYNKLGVRKNDGSKSK